MRSAPDPTWRAASRSPRGITLARRLGMLPGNICTPDYLADTARDIAKRFGMKSHGARAQGNAAGGDGVVPWRRAGNAAGPPADRARVLEGDRKTQNPSRWSGKASASTRRHLDQAGPAHGVDEVRHVRRRRVLGAMEAIGALELRSTSSGLSARRRTCRGQRVEAGGRCEGVERQVHRDHQYRRGRSACLVPTCWRTRSDSSRRP